MQKNKKHKNIEFTHLNARKSIYFYKLCDNLLSAHSNNENETENETSYTTEWETKKKTKQTDGNL